MKTRIILSVLLVAIFFTGCKDEKSVDNLEVVTPEVVDESFKVTINATVKKDDTFSLYYTEDGSTDFKLEPLWLAFKGNNAPQDIVFSLPKDVLPTQIRLDFGITKDQEPIVINSFKMSYYKKEFQIPGNQFFIYFDPDLSKTVFDKNTATVTAVVKDGARQSPSFYPNTKPLGDEINKLVK
jgi:hypothetical protein